MADLQTDVSNAEGYAGWDIDDILLLVGVVIIALVGFAFFLYSNSVASIGVSLVSGFASPVSAFFNGLASAITGFFTWASHALSNLTLAPGLNSFATVAMVKYFIWA
jgi:hypothetical protein